jgi:membrane protein DedA with SNARE-associated domain
MEEQILSYIQQNPASAYFAVYGMLLLCGFGLPLPEDITLLAGGYTVYLADVNGMSGPTLIPMIAVGLVGVLTGDTLLFLLGRKVGPKIYKVWPFRRLFSESRVQKIHRFFARYGAWTAFCCRFAAGVRAPAYLIMGSANMKFRVFFLADGLAALISVPLLVWVSWRFGKQIDTVKEWLSQSKYAVAGLLLLITFFLVVKFFLDRQRQRQRKEQVDIELKADDEKNADVEEKITPEN